MSRHSSGPQKCYYEVLGVSREVNQDDLKKAYRMMALRWHPDKNQDNIEEATNQFKLIQAAWEVLSNEHERSWYDAHREQILRGSKPGADAPDEDVDDLELMHYFDASCFDGFNDEPNGFFTVYATVFEEINGLEQQAAKTEDINHDDLPSFGDSKSPWSQVKQFYAQWANFVSIRSFSWKDKWNLAEGPNRLYRRAMEKENKKERDVARKEFVSTIRELVEFVRRRDPRWAAGRLKQKQEEQAKVEAAAVAKRQAEAARAEQRKQWQAELAQHAAEMEAARLDAYGDMIPSDEEEQDVNEVFECFVCDGKRFKSAKQLENHEQSKKHRDALAALKKQMEKEERELQRMQQQDLENDASIEEVDEQDEFIDQEQVKSDNEEEQKPKKKSSKKGSKKEKQQSSSVADDDNGVDDELSSKKSKKKSKKGTAQVQDDDENEENYDVIDDEQISKKKKKKSKKSDDAVDEVADLDQFRDESAPAESSSKKKEKKKKKNHVSSEEANVDEIPEQIDLSITSGDADVNEMANKSRKPNKSKKKDKSKVFSADDENLNDEVDEHFQSMVEQEEAVFVNDDADDLPISSKKEKKKKKKKVVSKSDDDEVGDIELLASMKSSKSSSRRSKQVELESEEEFEDEVKLADRVEKLKLSASSPSQVSKSDDESDEEDSSKSKKEEKKRRRAKKEDRGSSKADADETAIRCMGCSATFPSKTKLFEHLKSNPRHAALKAK